MNQRGDKLEIEVKATKYHKYELDILKVWEGLKEKEMKSFNIYSYHSYNEDYDGVRFTMSKADIHQHLATYWGVVGEIQNISSNKDKGTMMVESFERDARCD